ncbi:MAG TPA: FtsX-like permease family protein [Puia sp.]|jgi:ABC-type lipoprotein release transport system permease subunit
MIKNYFITALRNLRRNKIFSLINVLGLAIGISAALVIYLIIQYDFSFEKFQKDRDRIYRVVSDMKFSGEPYYNSGVPWPLSQAAPNEISGIEEYAAFWTGSPKVTIPTTASAKPVTFKEQDNIIFTDVHYFNLFPYYKWLAGTPAGVLNDPFQVVLTKSRAAVYFPGLSPAQIIGRRLTYDDSINTTVTGIVGDLTENTDFTFKEFISLATFKASGLIKSMGIEDWGSINSSSQFFVKLNPRIMPGRIESQLMQLRKKNKKDEKQDDANSFAHRLQPLSDLHFNEHYGNYDQPLGHKSTLYGLMLVAIFLLVLGCINFINLTTAQASQRAKEIGIRKTLGSSGSQLLLQFLGETFMLTFLSLALSLALAPWLLHIFSDFIPKGLHFNLLHQPGILLFLLALLIIVTLLAGFYPAFLLSRYQPVLVLKNQAFGDTATTRKAWLRKTLTIFQFTIAQALIMGTLIVGQQIHYSINTELGFKKEAIVTFDTPYTWGRKDNHRFALLDKIRAIPGIELATIGSAPPSSGNTMSNSLTYKDGKKETHVELQIKYGDSNYFKMYQLHLLAGRLVEPSDTMRELLINETCRKLLGFKDPQEAIGKLIGNVPKYPIIGVMADFHQASLRTPIKPLALSVATGNEFTIHISLHPQIAGAALWSTTLARVGKAYKEIYPEEDFKYDFFDESIAKFYTSEQNMARLLKWATGLTIFISCLGLAGLVIYTTNLRTKEVGIRKVLGASVAGIVSLLSKDFVKLLGIAFLIATPIAWWALHKWLENYAYRIAISWWIFPLSGASMIAIALLTMSIRTIRSAMANPVNSLKSE